jgi:cytochrome b subunit of formate dehydrogenase
MISALSIFLVVVLVAIVCVLVSGIVVFARGGQANRKWSNRLMNMRVATQALAVLILGLIILLHKYS